MKSEIDVIRELVEELNKLGSTEAIAEEFRVLGIRGSQCALSGDCPVRKWMISRDSRLDSHRFGVGPYDIVFGLDRVGITNTHICRFIRLFDDGRFDFLNA